jgi:hypothetical protein
MNEIKRILIGGGQKKKMGRNSSLIPEKFIVGPYRIRRSSHTQTSPPTSIPIWGE